MAEPFEGRVAVYIDFDNIVISRYDQVHGRGAWRKDNVYRLPAGLTGATDEIKDKLRHAEVDISAILDFASSFGTIVLSRVLIVSLVAAGVVVGAPLAMSAWRGRVT